MIISRARVSPIFTLTVGVSRKTVPPDSVETPPNRSPRDASVAHGRERTSDDGLGLRYPRIRQSRGELLASEKTTYRGCNRERDAQMPS